MPASSSAAHIIEVLGARLIQQLKFYELKRRRFLFCTRHRDGCERLTHFLPHVSCIEETGALKQLVVNITFTPRAFRRRDRGGKTLNLPREIFPRPILLRPTRRRQND